MESIHTLSLSKSLQPWTRSHTVANLVVVKNESGSRRGFEDDMHRPKKGMQSKSVVVAPVVVAGAENNGIGILQSIEGKNYTTGRASW